MIEVKQTILHDPENGKFGNCFSATVASLLHIDIDDVPVFDDVKTWVQDFNAWLKQYGLAFFTISSEDQRLAGAMNIKGWYHEVGGKTNRSKDTLHACVGLDDDLIFDPHPSNDFLINADSYGVFITLEPWRTAEIYKKEQDESRSVATSI